MSKLQTRHWAKKCVQIRDTNKIRHRTWISYKVSIYMTLSPIEPASSPVTPSHRARGPLAERIRSKGWSIIDAADYLGVARQTLYSVFRDPQRPRLWECAIAGMPACTPALKKSLRDERKLQRAQRQALRPSAAPVQEFEIGDEVVCAEPTGFCDEGERGEIKATRPAGGSVEILVCMPDGEDWFPKNLFYKHFQPIGINIRM